jgi:MoxR-like ATPase
VNLLLDSSNRARASSITPIIEASSVTTMAQLASDVHADGAVMAYLSEIVTATRTDNDSALGVSIRGALALARATKTWAIASGRSYVTPDDVRDLAVPVLAHRVIVDPEAEFAGVTGADVVDRAVATVNPPAYRAA